MANIGMAYMVMAYYTYSYGLCSYALQVLELSRDVAGDGVWGTVAF